MLGLTILFLPFNGLRLSWDLLLDNTNIAPDTINTLLTVSGISSVIARLVIWGAALAAFVFVMLRLRQGRLNIPALVGYILLSLVAIGFSGPNLTSYGYGGGNYSLVLPALVAGGIALGAAALLSRYERMAWVGLIAAAVLCSMVLCVSPQPSFWSTLVLIPQVLLTSLVGLIGFRAWTIADLEASRTLQLESDNSHRSAQLRLEIEGLNRELALLESKQNR